MSRIFRWLEPVLGIVLGFSLALLITWWIAPIPRVHSTPDALHTSFKDEYRLLVSFAYQATADVERARTRLSLLHEFDAVQSLVDQAIRLQSGQAASVIFPGEGMQSIQALALLAQDLQHPLEPSNPTFIPTVPALEIRPTITWMPFDLVSMESVCDPTQLVPIAHIYVGDSSGQPVPGVQVIVTGDEEQQKIFTGLKPEMGLGYADFIMTYGSTYTLQLQSSYQPFTGILSPIVN